MSTSMDAEFDVMPRWVAEAVAELGPGHAGPAACRGSVGPAGLRWLADRTRVGLGGLLVDVGGGMGGPAAWAREQRGAAPLVVEPQPGACWAARRMFGLPTVVGSGDAVPVGDGRAASVWCLGVLCTTTDKLGLLCELRRIATPGGRLGLFVLVDRGLRDQPPAGNSFPSEFELAAALATARLEVVDSVDVADLPAAPPDWERRTAETDEAVRARHGREPAWRRMQDQQARLARLLDTGQVAGRLLAVHRPGEVSRRGA